MDGELFDEVSLQIVVSVVVVPLLSEELGVWSSVVVDSVLSLGVCVDGEGRPIDQILRGLCLLDIREK